MPTKLSDILKDTYQLGALLRIQEAVRSRAGGSRAEIDGTLEALAAVTISCHAARCGRRVTGAETAARVADLLDFLEDRS